MNIPDFRNQRVMLKKHHYNTRGKDKDTNIPVTGRSLTLYTKQLFPDLQNNTETIKYLKNKAYIDIGSGINHLLPHSLLYKLCQDRQKAFGIDIINFTKSKCYRVTSIFKMDIKSNSIDVITCNNFMYFWLDNPVFFGNYYYNNTKLHKYLNEHFSIRTIIPIYHKEQPYYYEENKIKRESKSSANEEIRINKLLKAHTLILYKI